MATTKTAANGLAAQNTEYCEALATRITQMLDALRALPAKEQDRPDLKLQSTTTDWDIEIQRTCWAEEAWHGTGSGEDSVPAGHDVYQEFKLTVYTRHADDCIQALDRRRDDEMSLQAVTVGRPGFPVGFIAHMLVCEEVMA